MPFEVRGLLGYLLSKPDDWECRMSDIEREGGIKSTARRTMMKAAEVAGYLTFERTRNGKGQFESAYTVHEEPVPIDERTESWRVATQPDADEPPPDDPGVDNPQMDKPQADGIGDIEKKEVQQKTDLQKTEKREAAPSQAHHPAIQLFRTITNRYPDKSLHQRIISTLGDQPNADLLGRCYTEWVSRGWNKMNLAWLFDWYPKGEPQALKNKGAQNYAKFGNGNSAIQATGSDRIQSRRIGG